MLNFLRTKDYYPPILPTLDLHLRIPFKKCKNWRVLFVGAGSGYSSLAMQIPYLPCKELTFLDVHKPYLDSAAARTYKAEKVNFVLGDIRNYDCNSYDLVLIFDVLEHLEKEESLQVIKDIKTRLLVFLPLEKHFRKNVFGAKSQDHLSLWTEENFKVRGFKTEVLKNFHCEEGERFDALWAVKY